MPRLDPHSYADTSQPQTESIDWNARVDFDARIVEGEAALHFVATGSGELDLDTRDLKVTSVSDSSGAPLKWSLGDPDPILGQRLGIGLGEGTGGVRIRYSTSPQASALQWLEPAQTFGGQHPFLFSQGQAIHARSVLPCQDTPRIRIRFKARIDTPAALTAVMGARSVDRNTDGARSIARFEMDQRIPPYLIALAVGNLESAVLGPRSSVWAEPEILEQAAWEFAEVDRMLQVAERLFGPYDWERFDLLTMPQAFPYGGMENPRLTFLTPTLLAKDRSLVNVVAHELAHSWTGNLVSNASAEDFWLNEGFTVFAERRILEALEGPEVAALHAALGRRALDRALEQFRDQPELTRLKTRLTGIDPDDAFSQVPYEKGYLFLRALEEAAGRDAFSKFLLDYIRTFRFQSITTEDFLAFLEQRLPGTYARVNGDAWVHGSGVPSNEPRLASQRLARIEGLEGRLPPDELARQWTATELQLYLESVSTPVSASVLDQLDQKYALSASNNYEVLVAWLTLAAKSSYAPALPRTEEVLGKVGRMKYLKPLYQALVGNEATKRRAREFYEKSKSSYHPIARQGIEGLLARAGA